MLRDDQIIVQLTEKSNADWGDYIRNWVRTSKEQGEKPDVIIEIGGYGPVLYGTVVEVG